MKKLFPLVIPRRWLPVLLLAAAVWPVAAEQADRKQPIVIEADKPGTLDLQRQVMVFNGNVKIEQGTMLIRADRIEVRELPDGQRAAVATGSADRPASYRQKRDAVNEIVEGSAARIEYDGRSGQLRFVGNSTVRRLRDGVVADQITGAVISWDDASQVFAVQGGDPAAGGRVRAVLTPRADAGAPPASGAAR